MKIDCVIFDMDGVIFDSESVWQKGFLFANEFFHLNFTEEFRQTCCGKGEKQIRDGLRPILGSLTDEYRDFICNYVEEFTFSRAVPIKNGFFELIEFLQAHNVKIALATSSKKDRALTMFKNSNVDQNQIFDTMIFCEDVTLSKPNPEIFVKAATSAGVEPTKCVVLEDSINGIEAAYAGGLQSSFVIDLIPPNDFVKQHASLVANSLFDVKEWLKDKI